MNYYRVYCKKIETDLIFPQLVNCEDNFPADVTVKAGIIPNEYSRKDSLNGADISEKISWLTNLTCKLLVEDGNRITYEMREKPEHPDWLQTYILGWGMAMLALQLNSLPIHCSCVSDDKGAVIIAGNSGAGKSTLTSAFLNVGYSLMADDMAMVETKNDITYAKPAFPFQKLCRNVAMNQGLDLDKLIYINEDKDKFLVPYNGNFNLNEKPIKGLIFLTKTEAKEATIEEVIGLDKFSLVMYNIFLTRLFNREKIYEPYIGAMGLKMAQNVRMACIRRPAEGETTKQVIKYALDMIKKWDNE